ASSPRRRSSPRTAPSRIRPNCGQMCWPRPELMATEVLMPALSPTMTEGKIARWLKAEGESVSPGDLLAESATDKARIAMAPAADGGLPKIVLPEGTDHVAVNTPIALLAANGAAPASARVASAVETRSRPSGPAAPGAAAGRPSAEPEYRGATR